MEYTRKEFEEEIKKIFMMWGMREDSYDSYRDSAKSVPALAKKAALIAFQYQYDSPILRVYLGELEGGGFVEFKNSERVYKVYPEILGYKGPTIEIHDDVDVPCLLRHSLNELSFKIEKNTWEFINSISFKNAVGVLNEFGFELAST